MSDREFPGPEGSPLATLERILELEWTNIRDAWDRTNATLLGISKIIEGKPGPDTSVVVHGSLARQECTIGSDLDWTLLVDGVADASVQHTFLAIKGALNDETDFKRLGLKVPGQEGTFGSLAFSQPMMHYIGGEEDSNSNTTRRILLLLEAMPIGNGQKAFQRVRQGILRRYLDEDRGLLQEGHDDRSIRWVPLFLLNDFARYWRTMAVDFAYKQFTRGNKGYAIRSIKLGTSRKLLFASGLLACFWCDPNIAGIQHKEPQKQALIDHLEKFLSLTPLERLARFFVVHINRSDSTFLRETARKLFETYDAFIGLLNDDEKRKRLEELKSETAPNDEVFQYARSIRRTFRLAIQDMFLHNESPLQQHSIEKGVF